METKSFTKMVSLSDLWSVFTQRLWIILLAAVVAVIGTRIYETHFKTPMYESTATLYILRRDNEVDYTYTQSDFKLALDVVNDCTYVLKSTDVLLSVQQALNLDMSLNRLSQSITTKNPENTRFLEITVSNPSPSMAKAIVDCLCDKGSVRITESMGFDQVNLYSYGRIPGNPSNMLTLFAYAIIGLGVMLVVYSIFLMAFFLDDKLKTADDINKYLGISLLSEIPNEESNTMRKKYRYRDRSKYQYASSKYTKQSTGKRG